MPNLGGGPSPDGKFLVLVWTEDGKEPVQIPLAAKDIGRFAMGALGESIRCAEISGVKYRLPDEENAAEPKRYAYAHDIGIADAVDRDDVLVLSFAVGTTEVSLGIHKKHLRELGRHVLTRSADEQAPQ